MTTQENKTYNGWTNYETWCINLWLSNDEGLYDLVRDKARVCIEVLDAYDVAGRRDAALDLAQWLKDDLCAIGSEYGLIPALEGFPADLMGAALSEVNWDEVAQAWIREEQ